jgi:hypothetical protein
MMLISSTDWNFLTTQGSWSPTALSPALWLRSDLGITTSSNKVSQWNDQSSNHNNCMQSNTNYQPAYHSSGGQNNRPYLQGATGCFLSSTTNVLPFGTTRTVWIVAQAPQTTPAGMMQMGVGSPYIGLYNEDAAYTDYVYSDGVAVSAIQTSQQVSYPSVNLLEYDWSSTTINFYVNGNLATLSTNTVGNIEAGSSGYQVLATYASTTAQFYEVIVISGTATPAQRTQVQNYVSTLYNI